MPLTLRWTIGNVSESGWQALQLSVLCAFGLFPAETAYVICVNGLSLGEAQARTGALPHGVAWHDHSRDLPASLQPFVNAGMSEGTAWKLAPPRLSPPHHHELALDNDLILWELPPALREWLGQRDRSLLAADVERALGRFDALCPPGAFNSGIRGLPPGLDFPAALLATLARAGSPPLTSELDEQGLQVAALGEPEPLVVPVEDVTICSPFWPKMPALGRCGAHFVGLNAHHLPWNYYDRPADACQREHWEQHLPALRAHAARLSPGFL